MQLVDTLAASHIQANSSMRLWERGARGLELFKELSKKVLESTGDPRAGIYFGKRISFAIQRAMLPASAATVPRCGGFEDVEV
ncbi:jg1693 [Pararge aegeria aegeria]|uniref:Jg1693 protein n=1 Tax=Pararge aegeria aegeria TaxID=348720 RepID=A0A8S4SHY8_9NEOP|nr:jg1693 [Pararge aegeria aegeria]